MDDNSPNEKAPTRSGALKFVEPRTAPGAAFCPAAVFPLISVLLLSSYIAGGDVRPVATNGLESGRFQGFL